MVSLNFLTEKVQKYHEKKLNEAIQKLKLHQKIKKRLETELKTTDDKSDSIQKEISIQNENIAIWGKKYYKNKRTDRKTGKINLGGE